MYRSKSRAEIGELIEEVEAKILKTEGKRVAIVDAELEQACKRVVAEGVGLSAFTNCVDIVYADANVMDEELNFLEKLVPLLGVGKRNVDKIIDVIMIKNQAP